jgi:anti-sigma-K factor RskA
MEKKMSKKKDIAAEFDRMVARRAMKLSKFNCDYEELAEYDEIEVNASMRDLVERDDVFGNLGRIS